MDSVWARHTGYITSGTIFRSGTYLERSGQTLPLSGVVVQASGMIPIFTNMPMDQCGDTPSDFYGARHIYYKPDDLVPVFAKAYKCCDAVVSGPRVELDCWLGSGITYKVVGRSYNVANCATANQGQFWMEYSGGGTYSGYWYGQLGLRGGTLDFLFNCQSGVAFDSLSKFRLQWRGCASGEQYAGYNCFDPLFVNFNNISFMSGDTCCDCNTLYTIEGPQINLTVEANCYPVVIARHVAYTADATPVFAKVDCQDYFVGNPDCHIMTCGLIGTIDDVDGTCTCLNGSWNLSYSADSFWDNINVGVCSSPGEIQLQCTQNLDENGLPDGTLTLTATVTCGADNTGTDSVIVPIEEMELLDVTFNIDMEGIAPGSCGTCRYMWVDMTSSWTFISNSCTGSCSCVAPTTPGTFDGEIVDTDCSSGGGSTCCVGPITLRVTRE